MSSQCSPLPPAAVEWWCSSPSAASDAARVQQLEALPGSVAAACAQQLEALRGNLAAACVCAAAGGPARQPGCCLCVRSSWRPCAATWLLHVCAQQLEALPGSVAAAGGADK
uniref:Uncharacterized protein n=1 Tax=Tetradesmus obliquus TaxID=3088 RepID=A0A383WPW7_TETOB